MNFVMLGTLACAFVSSMLCAAAPNFRSARGMMIDMRGTPDTDGICKKAEFKRNATDPTCQLFYRCVDFGGDGKRFVIFRFMCGPMSIFDERLSICSDPARAYPKCGISIQQLTIPTKPTQTPTEPSQPATAPSQPATAPSQPATETSQPVTEPSQPATAPSQPATESSQTPTEPTAKPTVPSPTPTKPTTQPTEPSATEPTPKPPLSIDCTDEKLHSYPYDCARFYQCVQEGDTDKVYVFSCADGLHFNETLAECVREFESSCQVAPSNSTTSFIGNFELDCGSDDLHRYPVNCGFFYQCFKEGSFNTIYIYSCVDGLIFDEPTSSCTKPSETSACTVQEGIIRNSPFQLGQQISIYQIAKFKNQNEKFAFGEIPRPFQF